MDVNSLDAGTSASICFILLCVADADFAEHDPVNELGPEVEQSLVQYDQVLQLTVPCP